MVKKEKDVIFLLDFDGVLFDTSLEAYYVMSETHEEGSINKSTQNL
jgi:beta-phosphoglucomutase-like phosphatase (HAD superfamily)